MIVVRALPGGYPLSAEDRAWTTGDHDSPGGYDRCEEVLVRPGFVDDAREPHGLGRTGPHDTA